VTIEQTNIIDFVGLDRRSQDVVFTISDHLDWTEVQSHLEALSSKLNTYLAFILDGEMDASYPQYIDKNVRIDVIGQYEIPREILNHLCSEISGVRICYRNIAPPNKIP